MLSNLTKQKIKDGVQQEILSNYYLQKYDTLMKNINSNYQNSSQHNNHHNHQQQLHSSRTQRKKNNKINFKTMILEKKYTNMYQEQKKKDHEIKIREGTERKQKENKDQQRIRQKLSASIIEELNSPSPSKIESGQYKKIQITAFNEELVQKISLESAKDRYLKNGDESSDIEINQHQLGQQLQIQNTMQSDLRKIEENIQDDSVRKSKIPVYFTPQNGHYGQIQDILEIDENSSKGRKKEKEKSLKKSIEIHSNNTSYNISRKNSQQVRNKSMSKKQPNQNYRSKQQKNQNISNQWKVQSLQRKYSKQPSFSPKSFNYTYSVNNQKFSKMSKQSPKSFDNLSIEQSKQHSKDNTSHKISNNILQSLDDEILPNHVLKENDHPFQQLKQQTNQLSMISRFSMASDQGWIVKQKLQKQLIEHQFGPYQNALEKLRTLSEQNPKIWPILSVTQRILDNRSSYQNRRMQQKKQIQTNENKIKQIKQKLIQNEGIIKLNQKNIIQMAKQLAIQY